MVGGWVCVYVLQWRGEKSLAVNGKKRRGIQTVCGYQRDKESKKIWCVCVWWWLLYCETQTENGKQPPPTFLHDRWPEILVKVKKSKVLHYVLCVSFGSNIIALGRLWLWLWWLGTIKIEKPLSGDTLQIELKKEEGLFNPQNCNESKK